MNGRLRLSPQLTALAVLVWLGGLLGIYFVGLGKRDLLHGGLVLLANSIGLLNVPDTFWKLCGGRVVDLSAVSLLLGSAWCVGLALLRALRWVERVDPLTHLLAIAAGLGVWSWFILLAGLAGFISPGLYLWPALLSLLLFAWHGPWLRTRRQSPAQSGAERLPVPPAGHAPTEQEAVPLRSSRRGLCGLEIFLVACLGVGILLNVIPAFAPEIEYDALEYHLGALKEYQKAGRVCFLPYNFYASMPSTTEMLYLWGITLRSSAAAKLLHGSFGLLTALGLISFGTRLHSRKLGLTAAALFYLLPFVTSLAETARIDLATTFFAFLAGAALHRHLFDGGHTPSPSKSPPAASGDAAYNHDKRDLWLAALAAGLTLSTKYTAGPVVLLPLLVVLFIYRRPSSILQVRSRKGTWSPRNFTSSILFALLAFVPLLPWLIKNWVLTGNPVYPIANGLFHSPYWNAASDELFHSRHAPTFGSAHAWAGFFTSAWSNSTSESFASPILLLFAPLFVLLAKPEPRWKFCAWYGGLIYVCWFAFTFRPWRFLFPAVPWFALLGAGAIVALEKERATGLLVRVTLVILLVFNLNYSFLLSAVDVSDSGHFPPEISKLAVFFGRLSSADYLNNLYSTIGLMNQHLPDDACILFVGEARTYYTRHRVLANTVYDRSLIGEMVASAKTPDDLLREMRARGVTHIYVRQDELDRLRQNYGYLKDMNWTLFNEFLAKHTKVLFRNKNHAVYEIVQQKQG